MPSKTAEVVSKFVDLLDPLSPEDRQKVVSAGLTLLGEPQVAKAQGGQSSRDDSGLPSKAQIWAKQNNVGEDALNQVFHIANGAAEVIASDVPGKSKKEQVFNCYLLTGIAALVSTGDTSFDDQSARTLCQSAGCYDKTNHATYMKDKSNDLAGNKDRGWSLTNPGLKSGAALVKQIAQASNK